MLLGSLIWGGLVLLFSLFVFFGATVFYSNNRRATTKYVCWSGYFEPSTTWEFFSHNAAIAVIFLYLPALVTALIISSCQGPVLPPSKVAASVILAAPLVTVFAGATIVNTMESAVLSAQDFAASCRGKLQRTFWASIAPHGILELPTIFFTIGHAIWLLTTATAMVVTGAWLLSSAAIMAVCVVILFIAAYIEADITPLAMERAYRRGKEKI